MLERDASPGYCIHVYLYTILKLPALLNFAAIYLHLLSRMNAKLDFICMGSVELWETRSNSACSEIRTLNL